MENKVLFPDDICRTCLEQKDNLLSIYSHASVIKLCATVDISQNDGLPSSICTECYKKVKSAVSFRTQCESADSTLRKCLKKGLPFKRHLANKNNECTEQTNEKKQLKKSSQCYIRNCNSKKGDDGITLHDFPSEDFMQIEWIGAIKQHCKKGIELSADTRICNLHFNKTDYRSNKLLKRSAIPSVFPEVSQNEDCGPSVDCIKVEVKVEISETGSSFDFGSADFAGEKITQESNEGTVNRFSIKNEQSEFNKSNNLDDNDIQDIKQSDLSEDDNVDNCDNYNSSGSEFSPTKTVIKTKTNGATKKCSIRKSLNQSKLQRKEIRRNKDTDYKGAFEKIEPKNLKKCRYCHVKFLCEKQLNAHEKKHEERHFCDICGKEYPTHRQLVSHKGVHKREGAHLCTTCGKTFTMPEYLVQHERTHTGIHPYKCPHCPNRTFAQKNQLKSHLVTHTTAKPHLCSQCGNAYARPRSLRVHIRRIHPVPGQKRSFICTVCGREFIDKRDLSSHMGIHRHARSYICGVCGKAFNRSSNLRVHERIHTGHRPFACSVCGRSFIQKHVLDSHMRTHSNEAAQFTGIEKQQTVH